MNYSTKKYVVLCTKILQYVVKNCINFSVEYSRILSYNYFRITMYKYIYRYTYTAFIFIQFNSVLLKNDYGY